MRFIYELVNVSRMFRDLIIELFNLIIEDICDKSRVFVKYYKATMEVLADRKNKKKYPVIDNKTSLIQDKKEEPIESTLKRFANSSCRKCNGRGYLGIYINRLKDNEEKYVPCKCFIKKFNAHQEEERVKERIKIKEEQAKTQQNPPKF